MSDSILSPSAADYVDSYVARRVPTAVWASISADVKQTVLRSASSLQTAKTMCSHVAGYVAWLHSEGLPTTVSVIADGDVLERYIQTGMPGVPDGSRATRRAILRRVAERVAPHCAPAPAQMRYRFVRPPYESWQLARYWQLAADQPTRGRRCAATSVLTFGLGAGLDGRDLAWVRGTDIEACGQTVWVRVQGGPRPRRVVCLDQFAERALACAEDAGERLVVAGGSPGTRNVTSGALARLISDPALPRLLTSRLRSTWLLTHLTLGTPLDVLLPAAGLSTARPLEDLLPLVPPAPTQRVSQLLRGVA
jgi:hypothetical protein